MDGQRVANIVMKDVQVRRPMSSARSTRPTLMQAVVLEANVALGAEALGIMEQLNAKTLEYTKTREQFGVPSAASRRCSTAWWIPSWPTSRPSRCCTARCVP
jgi:alkylation response protein AidB-like acyl-CoA dehydrogenase